MSRSNYSDDCEDQAALNCWRGAVRSAARGARGQALLRELLAGMDAMPEKRLIAHELVQDGCFCALGVVGQARGLDMSALDPEDAESVAKAFNIADALAREIVYMNDESCAWQGKETPEQRFTRMRKWVESQITQPAV